jgi:hypothetical protein
VDVERDSIHLERRTLRLARPDQLRVQVQVVGVRFCLLPADFVGGRDTGRWIVLPPGLCVPEVLHVLISAGRFSPAHLSLPMFPACFLSSMRDKACA